MKAIILREYGGPEVLRYEDVPLPIPGPGQVLIKVHSVSVNRTLDLQVRQNGGGYGVPLPMTLGVDPAGVVESVGEGVSHVRTGDRVAAILRVQESCGYAEYATVPAAKVHLIPDALSFPEATVITRHFPVAYSMARIADLKEGHWALIMGAAGALGSCLVQLGRHFGANVIAAAGADERVQAARDMGAQHGVNYRTQDLTEKVMSITDGRGVNVVFESIGDPSLWPGAFNSLAFRGQLVTVGSHGGGMVTLDVKQLYLRRLRIVSGLDGSLPDDVRRSMELAVAGEFQAHINRTLPLREAAEAHRLAAAEGAFGKFILDPTLP